MGAIPLYLMGVSLEVILGPRGSQENTGSRWDLIWLPRRPPFNIQVWLPPRIHFGSTMAPLF